MELRDYQDDLLDQCRRKIKQGYRAPIVQVSTGGGKTPIAAKICQGIHERGKSAMFLAHRDSLITQGSLTLDRCGIPHGRIQAGYSNSNDKIQVASVKTLVNHLDEYQAPDFIIVDECHHHLPTNQWGQISERYGSIVIGFTATPYRLDGKGLGVKSGGIFDSMIVGPPMLDLIARGFLVPLKLYGPAKRLKAEQLKIVNGEYTRKSLDSLHSKPELIGDAVSHWFKFASGCRTLVFCHSIIMAELVRDQFQLMGITSETITGNDSRDEQKRKITMLGTGHIMVLTSVDVVSEGTDIPSVDCGIMMRPTASLSLYLQQAGRIMRVSEGKTNGILLDMVGNISRHGFPHTEREWNLNPVESVNATGRSASVPVVKQCVKCFQIFASGLVCPWCGHVHEGKELHQTKGELEEIKQLEIDRKILIKRRKWAVKSYQDCLDIENEFEYEKGWARMYWNNKKRR